MQIISFMHFDICSILNCINSPFSQGKKIRCSTSQAKNRLFIGNVPRSWGEEDLRKTVTEAGPGVTAVELVKVCTMLLYITFLLLIESIPGIFVGHS